jgi:glyoxylase-like metal-dependent hydrolase (beta-lactamase superfamily II)
MMLRHCMGRSSGIGRDGAGRLGASLAAAGIKAEDIDIVLLTHGRIDHLSGIMAADKPIFPNAQIAISKTDFDFWTDQGNLLPNKDRLLFVENGKDPIKGVTAISTPGHTPGHVSYHTPLLRVASPSSSPATLQRTPRFHSIQTSRLGFRLRL